MVKRIIILALLVLAGFGTVYAGSNAARPDNVVTPMIFVKGKIIFFPFDRPCSFYALFLSSCSLARCSRLPAQTRAS